MEINYKTALLEYLMQFVSENKQRLFLEICNFRTHYLTVAIENVFQAHNASAVIRSCDCFGIQDVHIIENGNEYTISPNVAMGASKWLSVHRYNEKENNTVDGLNYLKSQGFKLVATSPHHFDYQLDDLPLDSKIAILLGTELEGLSDEAFQMADYTVNIPMYGFTESYNVSVSAALIMYELTRRLHNSNLPWKLSEEEKIDLLLQWTRGTVKSAEALEFAFKEIYRQKLKK